jgi:hypothetical protein
MKLKDYKVKINNYFQTITPEGVIELFEEFGHLFNDIYSPDAVTDLETIKGRIKDYFISITPDEFHDLGYEFMDCSLNSK